ncbi:hypothetical protein NIES267_24820 [Calothrix parasitica NIES-267]|uniref:ATP-grasp domain-containing protein n=1 Tax=Calothrix parasitica NIES-267 TaxID=1973488 RepID=A0A1Z4LP39_9CYAN|nr:hypothetical protein NIES267_24820 [Calothrix parasitica NIES-267]
MHLSRDVVLLITHSGDFYTVDRVSQALSRLGAKPFRLNTDMFPLSVELATHVSKSGNKHWLKYDEEYLNIEQVRAVWMRRIWQPQLATNLAPKYHNACIRESVTTLDGFWDSLRAAHWVDNLQRINIAENKLRQLRVAQEIGLSIPQTLVTNNPSEAREFFLELKGKVVVKLLTPLSYSMKGSSFFFYTSKVKEEDLLDAETLSYCPMIFQEQIPKQRELRIVFVDGNFFVGALDASQYAVSTTDWRCADNKNLGWEGFQLPEKLKERLNLFMKKFGLLFGAFDFIQTHKEEYFFLEINPTGEWGMLERDLELPISNAIANALLKK